MDASGVCALRDVVAYVASTRALGMGGEGPRMGTLSLLLPFLGADACWVLKGH